MQVKLRQSITREMSVTLDGQDIDLEIPMKPTSYNDGDPIVTKVGGKLTLTYLVDDSDCENPLESWDGEGGIYTARRHATKKEHAAMQKALGLNDDWMPNLADEGVGIVLSEMILNSLKTEKSMRGKLYRIAKKYGTGKLSDIIKNACFEYDPYYDASSIFTGHFTKKTYTHYLTESEAEAMIWLGDLLEGLVDDAWTQGKERGLVGNPLAVILDIYEHGGISYSISGTGMQCNFDTSRAAAVWVPDESAVSNIKINAAKKLGVEIIVEQMACVGILPEHNKPYILSVMGKTFDKWDLAADFALSQFDPSIVLSVQQDIARESCRGSVELYNDWCNGNCYGIVSASYQEQLDGSWILLEDDSAYGYIGYESALNEAKSLHESDVKFMQQQ